MAVIILLFSLFISIELHASVLKHEVLTPVLQEFSYLDVCEAMGAKNPILISPKGPNHLECLNKKYSLIDFCLNKFPMDKILTRGFFDLVKKKVICESSSSVMISVSCESDDLKYCLVPKKGCEELKKIYANRLEIAHYGMPTKSLNCYFSKHIEENLNEL
jgi:hypothetical protein